MAEETAGGIYVKIGGDSSELNKAVKDSKSAIKDLGGELREGVTDLAKWSAATAAAGAAMLAYLVQDGIAAADAQADLAASLNTTSSSLAVLERAGDVAGLSLGQITASSKLLTLNLSKAAEDGASPAAEALKALGLSASDLAAMPLDQRIEAINTALQENVPITQQAALAADLFGAKNAQAMMQLSPDVIAESARQAELYGTALNEVDAAKIGAAADSFGEVGMAVDGLSKQLGAQLSPAIVAVVNEMSKAIDEAGGMAEISKQAYDSLLELTLFLMDSAEGVGRVFELTAKGIVVAFQTVITTVGGAITTLVEGANEALQLVGIESLDKKAEHVRGKFDQHMGILKQAAEDFNTTLERPLSSEKFRKFIEDAQVAGQAAAEETVAGTNDTATTFNAEKQAEVTAQKLEAFLAEQQALMAIELDLANQKVELNYVTNEQITKDNEAFTQERIRQAEQEAKVRQQVTQQTFSKLSSLMNSESRKMFEIGKAAAIGQTVYNTANAAMGAYSAMASIPYVGPALGVAAAGAAILYGAHQLQMIRNQQFGGGGNAARATGSNTAAVNAGTSPVAAQGATGGGNQNTLTLQGLGLNDLITGRMLMGILNEAQRDGSVIQMAPQ